MKGPLDIQRVAVMGAGQMGSGIAQVMLQSGLTVKLYDVSQPQLQSAQKRIQGGLEKLHEKGRLSEPVGDMMSRLLTTTDLHTVSDVEFLLEAVTEREDIKIDLLKHASRVVAADVIIASNTSSISITRLGHATGRPQQFIGIHFMNPAPLMKLVEVVIGLDTSKDTEAFATGLVERLGKKFVMANDFPGFIVNRILLPMINEAIYALGDGVGTAEHIDDAMVLGTNQPMGPLALADLIGLDTVLSIMEVMHSMFGDDKYRAAPLLRRYVDAGRLGRKSGRGFYSYPR